MLAMRVMRGQQAARRQHRAAGAQRQAGRQAWSIHVGRAPVLPHLLLPRLAQHGVRLDAHPLHRVNHHKGAVAAARGRVRAKHSRWAGVASQAQQGRQAGHEQQWCAVQSPRLLLPLLRQRRRLR